MKKKLLAIFLIVCVLAITISTTSLAYFTDTKEIKNTYEVGNVTIELTETSQWNGKLYPGIKITKEPIITNTGSESAYVGAKVVIDAKDPIMSEALFKELLKGYGTDTTVTKGLNTTTQNYEIYIVYNNVLASGSSVTLFDTLLIPSDYNNDQMAKFEGMKITVTAYAVQSAGMEYGALAALQAAFDVFDDIT